MSCTYRIGELLNRRAPNGVLVLDGALATELEERGCNINDELWSAKTLIENPDIICQVHEDYFRNGADVAITASYQATPLAFARRGISENEACTLIARSVELAKAARDAVLKEEQGRTMCIAGSVGPYGAYLANGAEYRGDYTMTEKEFQDFHRPRIAALIKAGVDCLALETMPSFTELQALLRLMYNFPATPFWISVTVRDEEHLSDGTPLAQAAKIINPNPNVIALGVNCVPEDQVTATLQHLAALTDKPLIAYPNSGEQYDADNKTWNGTRADGSYLRRHVTEWRGAGARFIGGCCRTTPSTIRTISECCEP